MKYDTIYRDQELTWKLEGAILKDKSINDAKKRR